MVNVHLVSGMRGAARPYNIGGSLQSPALGLSPFSSAFCFGLILSTIVCKGHIIRIIPQVTVLPPHILLFILFPALLFNYRLFVTVLFSYNRV